MASLTQSRVGALCASLVVVPVLLFSLEGHGSKFTHPLSAKLLVEVDGLHAITPSSLVRGYTWILPAQEGFVAIRATALEISEVRDKWRLIDLKKTLAAGVYAMVPVDEAKPGRRIRLKIEFHPVLGKHRTAIVGVQAHAIFIGS